MKIEERKTLVQKQADVQNDNFLDFPQDDRMVDESAFQFAEETRIESNMMDEKAREYEATLTPEFLIQ